MPKATLSRNQNPFSPSAKPAPSAFAPLNWGIADTGTAAGKFVRDLQISMAGKVVACGSRTIEGARTFAAAHGVPKAYGSCGELARDPEVEAVFLSSPNTWHEQDALACLRNGKAVLCEKPLAWTASQGEILFQAAEDHHAFLMEGLWMLHLPALSLVRKWITSGLLGEIRLVEAEWGVPVPFEAPGRPYDPVLGGGALLEAGIEPLSLVQWVGGNKTPRIKATARMTPSGLDESTSILLDWHSGLRAQVSCSTVHSLDRPARIFGTKGVITIPDYGKARQVSLETAEGTTVFQDSRTTEGYDYEVRAVTRGVRSNQNQDPEISKAFSLRLATTMASVRRQLGLTDPEPQ